MDNLAEQDTTKSNLLLPGDDVFQRVHYDQLEDKTIIETLQDIRPYLARNKQMYNENSLTKNTHRIGDRVMGEHRASIPTVIFHKWMKEFQAIRGDEYPPAMQDYEFKKYVKKKIKDPENRLFRVDGRTD